MKALEFVVLQHQQQKNLSEICAIARSGNGRDAPVPGLNREAASSGVMIRHGAGTRRCFAVSSGEWSLHSLDVLRERVSKHGEKRA